MTLLYYFLPLAFADGTEETKHRFVSVCKQVINHNVYDASPSEQSIYRTLKEQYYLDNCEMLWKFVDQQEKLVITHEGIQDFHPLDGHSHLLYLNIEGNALTKAENLPTIPQLRYLNLNGNQLENLNGSPEYPELKTLLIEDNELNDIEEIHQYTSLEWIDLSGNQITNLWPIRKLSNVKTLYVSDNKVSNILPLFYLESAVSLGLDGNPIRFCPRGTWTRVNGQKLIVPPFIQHYCIHLRQQETQSFFSFTSNSDEPQE